MDIRQVRLAAAAAITCCAAPAFADSFNYPDFSNTSGLTMAGSTTTAVTSDGTVLRIIPAAGNQAGAAYSTSPVTLGSGATFSTQFQFRFTGTGGVDPADGITFVVAASPGGLGVAGYGMGYEGVGNSIAIELDTYNNGIPGGSLGYFPAEPNSSNHVALNVNGVLTNSFATNVYGNGSCGFASGTPPQNPNSAGGCISNGNLWTATITYDGSLLNVSLLDPSMGATFHALTDVPLDLSSILGTNTAYVGFTGSSGAGWENEDIVNWLFTNRSQLPPVPEPATWAMMLGGFGLVGGTMRARRKAGVRFV
jgi:hypothetical protein